MNVRDFVFYFLPRIPAYQLARGELLRSGLPITLTFSVTSRCQSRCKTCYIWKNSPMPGEELTLAEIRRIFAGVCGQIYYLNISGGEPTLRDDLPSILLAACQNIHPRMIHIPTNGLDPDRVEWIVRESLQATRSAGWEQCFTVKPSLDGIGSHHDEIRGVAGNWEQLLDTVVRLKKLKSRFRNLYVELGTVISRFNADKIPQIAQFVQSMNVDNYRSEIAQERAEFSNIGSGVTPSAHLYAGLMEDFKARAAEQLSKQPRLARVTQAFRFVYYDLVTRILAEKRQAIPCFAGISNTHLMANGELWPCCVLGSEHSLGNLRQAGYDFRRVWHSRKAAQTRRFIRRGGCHCPMANQAYSNILCHWPSLMEVFSRILWSRYP